MYLTLALATDVSGPSMFCGLLCLVETCSHRPYIDPLIRENSSNPGSVNWWKLANPTPGHQCPDESFNQTTFINNLIAKFPLTLALSTAVSGPTMFPGLLNLDEAFSQRPDFNQLTIVISSNPGNVDCCIGAEHVSKSSKSRWSI